MTVAVPLLAVLLFSLTHFRCVCFGFAFCPLLLLLLVLLLLLLLELQLLLLLLMLGSSPDAGSSFWDCTAVVPAVVDGGVPGLVSGTGEVEVDEEFVEQVPVPVVEGGGAAAVGGAGVDADEDDADEVDSDPAAKVILTPL